MIEIMRWIDDITEFIFLEDDPAPANAIVVPGNGWPEPAERAAKLYRQGLAPLVVVSGKYSKGSGRFFGPACKKEIYTGNYQTEADFLTAVLMANGVPKNSICQDREAEFTLENAVNIRRLLEKENMSIDRIIICCQAFHARRCQMYFEYIFRDMGSEFILCPAETQNINCENWTQTQKGIDMVLGELKRCGEQFGWMMKPDAAIDISAKIGLNKNSSNV